MRKELSKNKFAQGFSLVEGLVTLLVIAIGLLGIVALQLTALRNTHSASIHSLASIYASDMVERVKANKEVAKAGNYNLAAGAPATVGAVNCVSAACSAVDLAAFDLAEWQQSLSDNLPSGQGEITLAGTTVTITVRWDDDRDGDTGTQCPPGDGDLDCFQIQVNL